MSYATLAISDEYLDHFNTIYKQLHSAITACSVKQTTALLINMTNMLRTIT